MKNSELQKILAAFPDDHEIAIDQYGSKVHLVDGLKVYGNVVALTEGKLLVLAEKED